MASRHRYGIFGTCSNCGRSRKAIEHFGWSCEYVQNLSESAEPQMVKSVILPADIPTFDGSLVIVKSASHNAFDPRETFAGRRNLLRSVQIAQKNEHKLLEELSRVSRNHKNRLLIHLSTWLMRQNYTNADKPERAELESISNVVLAGWDALQSEAEQLLSDLREAQAIEQQTKQQYQEKAPLGPVSSWFAADKDEITQLNLDHRKAADSRQRLAAKIVANDAVGFVA